MTMADERDKGTDGSSIKPVSSLRSHFEALKATGKTNEIQTGEKETPAKSLLRDTAQNSAAVRSSLDLPRPYSPWSPSGTRSDEKPVGLQNTVALSQRSPPTSGRRRPTSINLGSTAQLTPAVTVNSPKSPPKSMHGYRSGSRSPEHSLTPIVSNRISTYDNQPRRLSASPIEQRQANQGSGSVAYVSPPVSESVVSSTFPPRTSPIPPAVNRADKPKIPSKSMQHVDEGKRLTPEPREMPEKQLSPFSTPPSSQGSPSPERQDFTNSPTLLEVPTTKQHMQPKDIASRDNSEQLGSRSRDPRLQGFSGPTGSIEPRDPSTLSLSAEEVPYRDSRSVRASTLSERPVLSAIARRDTHDRTLVAQGPRQRYVSEEIWARSPPKLFAVPPAGSSMKQHDLTVVASSRVNTGELKAVSPARRAPPPPPPAPKEERGSRHNGPALVQRNPPADLPARPIEIRRQSSLQAGKINSDFQRPPRRNTYEEGESQISTALDIRSASDQPLKSMPGPYDEDSDEAEETEVDMPSSRSEYPDSSQTNRRPPRFQRGAQEIPTKFDSRVFDVCGRYACTTGYVTRAWDLSSGEQIMNLSHGETVKMLSIAFKPARNPEEEGSRIWIGSNIGEVHEVDIRSQAIVATSTVHNRREIVRILRKKQDMWTFDEEGKLFVWHADESRMPSLKSAHYPHRVPKGQTFSMAVRDELWYAAGREVSVFRPGSNASFSVLQRPLSQTGTGDITCGAYKACQGGLVYLGHADGKVTIYSAKNYTCTGIIKASDYKINAMSFVGADLWTAYKTGKIYVYGTSSKPWKVKKDWRAHEGPIASMLADLNGVRALDRVQVSSLGHDNCIRFWDGMLEDDWQEAAMQDNEAKYCTFRDVRAAVMTWNVGACNPLDIRSDFISDAIHVEDPPEILVFGFQEIVDLEDRAVTAKSILGFGKRKDKENAKSEQHVSRVYRQWRDYLGKCINRYIDPRHLYTEVHTSCLIGLFQCIFVRQEEKGSIGNMSSTVVKCGMKGHYGNKGALVTRFTFDHSSLCFVNCHLAAGQTQTSHRNNDIASILEANSLSVERNPDDRTSFYTGGGDGTQVLDHEICVLNGDLNYRIDAIPRDKVIKMIDRGELDELLERDQMMVSRRRVAGFRLSVFNEAPIRFAPTYKYDVGTDQYDSSEKKRAPAWCDRLLYRGFSRIKQTEYRRHEVRVSDHRPVSGMFKIRVKTIDPDKQRHVRAECHEQFNEIRGQFAVEAG